MNMEAIRHKIYSAVLGQKWEEVVEIYKHHPQTHTWKITKSEDTALHVAITLGAPHHILESLIGAIVRNTEAPMKSLAAKNNREDTPLHCAASRGCGAICELLITRGRQALVCARNKYGETPLFLAALNGHREAFLCLHSVYAEMEPRTCLGLWRRKNGDTILHSTIQRQYFDLALEIMYLYDEEMIGSAVNVRGVTPLQVLASIPSAFLSGTRLTWRHKLYYNYIKVEQLKIESKSKGYVVNVAESHDDRESRQLLKACAPFHKTRGSLRKIKEKHVRGEHIMKKLLEINSEYEYKENEIAPYEQSDAPKELEDIIGKSADQKDKNSTSSNSNSNDNDKKKEKKSRRKDKKSTALLVATKYGLIELVREIESRVPLAMYDKTEPKKRNIVLTAVHKRQSHILKFLMGHSLWGTLSQSVDANGNNVLHMAAFLPKHMPWQIHGSAMQMQYEAKWYEYVKENVPAYLSSQENKDGDTPAEVFAERHKDLLKDSNEWVKDTSGSYSIVAALTAGVTYATSYTVPGGTDGTTGKPILQGHTAYNIFVVSVLVSFCFSITSLAAFLAVYSSRKQPTDYRRGLPLKLCLGLTSFFVSIVSMLVSFCAAHSFELDPRIKHEVSPWYSLILIPLCFYTVAQIPLYWDLLEASFTSVPHPKYVGENVPM
ncbi:ankyrin repeat-containing protein ITN1 isoform X3 [Senna tora]|uniref:Ankyrin repeat-containing protein ITN1 isoform X3 n=1 Tax=Senna tora TaxID=362788 RepID=A0A834WA47_9FABA|nr:ankyrin repeat-containing protein ITN1 isoform X3 [Senna tora]